MIYVLIAFSLFVGNNVLARFGITGVGITPATYLLCAYSFFVLPSKIKNKSFRTFNKEELAIVILVILIFLYKLFSGHREFYAGLLNSILFPALTILLLPKGDTDESEQSRDKVFKIILIFFIVECSIAILERVLYINIFPATMHLGSGISSRNDISFRSAGLQNHALQNVLCIITILLFILYSDIKNNYKLWFSLLGSLALVSFNSRGALIIWAVIFSLYILIRIRQKSKNILTTGCIATFCFITLVAAIPLILIKYNLAGRLFSRDLLDDSGDVRLQVLGILRDFDFTFFIGGHSQEVLDEIILAMDILAIENFWIILLLKYGIVLLIPMIFIYGKLIAKYMRRYTPVIKYFIIGSFLLLASTNNSLDATGIPLMLFLICAYSFPKKTT